MRALRDSKHVQSWEYIVYARTLRGMCNMSIPTLFKTIILWDDGPGARKESEASEMNAKHRKRFCELASCVALPANPEYMLPPIKMQKNFPCANAAPFSTLPECLLHFTIVIGHAWNSLMHWLCALLVVASSMGNEENPRLLARARTRMQLPDCDVFLAPSTIPGSACMRT